MESLLGALAAFGIFILLIVIGIYVAQAIFLNKFNKYEANIEVFVNTEKVWN